GAGEPAGRARRPLAGPLAVRSGAARRLRRLRRGAAARRSDPVRTPGLGQPRRPGGRRALVAAGAGPRRPAAARRNRMGPAAARPDPAAAAVVGSVAVGSGGAAAAVGPAGCRPGPVLGTALRGARRWVVGGSGRPRASAAVLGSAAARRGRIERCGTGLGSARDRTGGGTGPARAVR